MKNKINCLFFSFMMFFVIGIISFASLVDVKEKVIPLFSSLPNGVVYENNSDYSLVGEFYSKACEANLGSACYNLAINYEYGRSVKMDFAEAKRLYIKSCNLNFGAACYRLAHTNDVANIDKQHFSRAIILFTKSCYLNYADACTDLALMYRDGNGVEKSEAKSVELLTKADKIRQNSLQSVYVALNNSSLNENDF